MEHEKEFHALLATFATNARVQLNITMLKIYDKAVSPFGYERACLALQDIMMEMKAWQMPPPNLIIDKIVQKPSRQSLGNEIAGRIMESVGKFGYVWPDKAREYIGEVGWSVVQKFGGWQTFCQDLGVSIDQSITRAQIRDAALAMLEINEKQNLGMVALPEPKKLLGEKKHESGN